MKNFIQLGSTLGVIAPYALLSGAGCLVGRIFGVAVTDALISTAVEITTVGVFDLPKAPSQAWTAGAAVFWDDTNKRGTTAASGNFLIGFAVLAVADGAGDTTGRVLLPQNVYPRAAFVANASAGNAAEINALRDALVTAGLMAPS